MRRLLMILVVVAAATLPAAARAQVPAPTRDTPAGPATLVTADDRPPLASLPAVGVLTGVRLTVGAGGQGARVRARLRSAEFGEVTGDWVDVPSGAAGDVVLPMPRVARRPFGDEILIDQQSGGLRIVRDVACTYAGRPIACASVRSFAGAPPQPTDRTPDAVLEGAELAAEAIIAPDLDGDLVADDADRTDLAVALRATPAAGGPTQLAVTLMNRGPQAATRPVLSFTEDDALRWEHPPAVCAEAAAPVWAAAGTVRTCSLTIPLAAGASVTVPFAVTAARTAPLRVAASSEGPDLQPADDVAAASLAVPPPPVAQLSVRGAARQRLARGVRIVVGSSLAGRVVATAELRAGTRHVRALRAALPRRGLTASVLVAGLGAAEELRVRVVR